MMASVRTSDPCPRHPQALVWWRTIPGYRGEHAACAICGWVHDSYIREELALVKPEAITIRSFAVYREHATRVAGSHTNDYFALGLCEEAGEVAGVVKKHMFHGHELHRDKLVEELGDTLWYLDQLARVFGITLEEVASANIAKLHKRYPDGFSEEASRNREALGQ